MDGLTTALVHEFKLGRHSWGLEIHDLAKFLIIISSRATFTITALGWTKTAFAVTLLRLTTGMTKSFLWFIIISVNITTIVSAAVPWIQCDPIAKTWVPDMPGACWAPKVGTKVWIGTAGPSVHVFFSRVGMPSLTLGPAYSALIDFTLAALPWTFLYNMLLRRREKAGILTAMSMGVM